MELEEIQKELFDDLKNRRYGYRRHEYIQLMAKRLHTEEGVIEYFIRRMVTSGLIEVGDGPTATHEEFVRIKKKNGLTK